MSWDDSNDAFETFMSQYNEPTMYQWESDPIDYENLPNTILQEDYSNEGRNYPTPESTQGAGGSPVNASMSWQNESWAKNLPSWMKSLIGTASNVATSKAGLAGLMALLSYLDRDKGRETGGGTTQAYAGPSRALMPITEQGKYGPIVRYAANGGLMHAYANGGKVQMEDGGFVMTKLAVDKSKEIHPEGIVGLLPGARMIGGPPDPTGRKDLTPAVIHGPNGSTPAKVSRGEAYVPKHVVDQHGGPDRMYAIMNKLQGRA